MLKITWAWINEVLWFGFLQIFYCFDKARWSLEKHAHIVHCVGNSTWVVILKAAQGHSLHVCMFYVSNLSGCRHSLLSTTCCLLLLQETFDTLPFFFLLCSVTHSSFTHSPPLRFSRFQHILWVFIMSFLFLLMCPKTLSTSFWL